MLTRVNSKGQRKRLVQCPPGSKRTHNGSSVSCKRMSGKERMDRKRGHIKSARTVKRNKGKQRQANFKRQRALKRRHSMGLK